MPFKSKAQQRFMFATMPETARQWAKETPAFKSLPEKLHKKQTSRTPPQGSKKSASVSPAGTIQKALTKQATTVKSGARKQKVGPKGGVPFIQKVIANGVKSAQTPTVSSPNLTKVASVPVKPYATTSILGGVMHTPQTQQSTANLKQKIASTRVRAKWLADQFFQGTLAEIAVCAKNADSPVSRTHFLQKSAFLAPASPNPAPAGGQPVTNLVTNPALVKPQLAGRGVMPTGLDALQAQQIQQQPPAPGKATAVPGMAGTAAANPIDMHGPLDPTGLALDGNHAAGVRKGFKIAGALTAQEICRRFELDLMAALGQRSEHAQPTQTKQASVAPLRALTDDPEWQAARRQSCPGCEALYKSGGGVCERCGASWKKKAAAVGRESSHSPEVAAGELWRASQLSQRGKTTQQDGDDITNTMHGASDDLAVTGKTVRDSTNNLYVSPWLLGGGGLGVMLSTLWRASQLSQRVKQARRWLPRLPQLSRAVQVAAPVGAAGAVGYTALNANDKLNKLYPHVQNAASQANQAATTANDIVKTTQQDVADITNTIRGASDDLAVAGKTVRDSTNNLYVSPWMLGGAGLGAMLGNGLYQASLDEDAETGLGYAVSSLAGAGLGGAAGYYGGTPAGQKQVSDFVNGLFKK